MALVSRRAECLPSPRHRQPRFLYDLPSPSMISRKRSRLDLEGDEETTEPRLFKATLKRTQTENEVDALGIVAAEEAWKVDVKGILTAPRVSRPSWSSLQAHNNGGKYVEGGSIFVVCVQGDCQIHYQLLCAMLPELYKLSPTLQPLVLCQDPNTHSLPSSAPFSLPLVQAVGPGYNHFVRLGLLHPAGGGSSPLDAITVLDAQGRRRLVLPFGWGAGRHVAAIGGGKVIQERMRRLLRNCVELLQKEL